MGRYDLSLFSAIVLILSASPVHAGTRHVPSSYTTIQVAIDAAVDGDIILVADGTYTGSGNRNLEFSGKAITVRSENGPDNCIIDCEQDGRGFYVHNGEDSTSVVDGFTITHGWVSPDWYGKYGGGIRCENSSPTIMNCMIVDNMVRLESSGGGGGIYISGGAPKIIDTTVKDNQADSGGGIACGGAATIKRCFILDNTARIWGGGINSGGASTSTVSNTVIAGNTSLWGAGGIYCGNIRLIHCTITGNTDRAYAGGIDCANNGTATLLNCIVWGNAENQISARLGGLVTVNYSDIQGGWSGESNIDADPLFLNVGNADYHLTDSSTCIGKGTRNGVPSDDIEGHLRPNPAGTRPDLGAYENSFGPPVPAFSADPTSGYVPFTVHFTDHSIGTVLSYLWDFGDGQTGTERHPSHTYALADTFTVSLTVTGDHGSDTEIKTDLIVVLPVPRTPSNGHLWSTILAPLICP